MKDPTYGQKITEIANDDGSVTVTTESYYEGLKSIKVQIREDVKTTYNTLLTDYIKCLDVLKGDTPYITVHISKDKYGSPNIIQTTYETKREQIK